MNDDSILAVFTGVAVGAAGLLFGVVGLNEPLFGVLLGIGLLGITAAGVFEIVSNQSEDHQEIHIDGNVALTERLLSKNALIVLLSLLLLGFAGAGITLTGI